MKRIFETLQGMALVVWLCVMVWIFRREFDGEG